MSELNGSEPPVLVVGIGEIKVGKSPATIRTNLGSCIAVCLYEPLTKVGGLLHIMLPSSLDFKDKPGFRSTKYADTGIPELVEELERTFGASRRSLKAKIFGGGKLLKGVSASIGDNNEAAAREHLKKIGIPIVASKTGGEKGYQVDMDLVSGIVHCRVFGEETRDF